MEVTQRHIFSILFRLCIGNSPRILNSLEVEVNLVCSLSMDNLGVFPGNRCLSSANPPLLK